MANAFRAASLSAFSIKAEYSSRCSSGSSKTALTAARDRHGGLDLATAVGDDRQHGKLRLAHCSVGIGDLGDALRTYHARTKDHPVAEIDRLAGPPSDRWIGCHGDHDERALVVRAGGDGVERPRVALAILALELDFEDGAEHGLVFVVDDVEQHDGVGVVLDGHELIERGLGEPRLVEPGKLDVQEVAEQAGSKRRVVPDQRDHAFVHQRWGRHGREPDSSQDV
jgi:hypothetical protein